jgi:hypothetical protein
MSDLTDADYITLGRVMERFAHGDENWLPYLFVGTGLHPVEHVTIDGSISVTADEAALLRRAWADDQ